jgi:hypothetical protein
VAKLNWETLGVGHSEFMPTGAVFNSERCVGTLQEMNARILRVRPYMEQIFLQHGNVRSYTSPRSTEEIHLWFHCLG